ncbi:MAG TPA: hypothetical protein VEA41_04000 [Salinarimonas sp.]|nr:hypothetical protein [Salinarimonas sp.]
MLAMSPAQQRSFFDGATDPVTGRKVCGVMKILGAASPACDSKGALSS